MIDRLGADQRTVAATFGLFAVVRLVWFGGGHGEERD